VQQIILEQPANTTPCFDPSQRYSCSMRDLPERALLEKSRLVLSMQLAKGKNSTA
jgi:hypothetical protein